MSVFGEKIDAGENVRNIVESDTCVVMQMADESGEGTMTAHRIFEGAHLMYNDFHMASCRSGFSLQNNGDFLVIDHCREGRIESEVKPGVFSFMQEHEMRIDNRKNHSGSVFFPLKHYHGITIGFDLSVTTEEIQKVFPGFSVDLRDIQAKFVTGDCPFVLKNEPGVEHIFSELYQVPRNMKSDYYKLKALELLLYLDALQVLNAKEERPYFYKGQVEKIKAVQELITSDLKRHYTTEELSKRFSVSPTALKNVFKEIYGDSLYSYLRRIRMNAAASMLIQAPEKSIGEIANEVGYENQGKFSTAFKNVIGQTPLEYRNANR